MKYLKQILFALLIITLTGCEKEPEYNFAANSVEGVELKREQGKIIFLIKFKPGFNLDEADDSYALAIDSESKIMNVKPAIESAGLTFEFLAEPYVNYNYRITIKGKKFRIPRKEYSFSCELPDFEKPKTRYIYVSPEGSNDGDGSSWENAVNLDRSDVIFRGMQQHDYNRELSWTTMLQQQGISAEMVKPRGDYKVIMKLKQGTYSTGKRFLSFHREIFSTPYAGVYKTDIIGGFTGTETDDAPQGQKSVWDGLEKNRFLEGRISLDNIIFKNGRADENRPSIFLSGKPPLETGKIEDLMNAGSYDTLYVQNCEFYDNGSDYSAAGVISDDARAVSVTIFRNCIAKNNYSKNGALFSLCINVQVYDSYFENNHMHPDATDEDFGPTGVFGANVLELHNSVFKGNVGTWRSVAYAGQLNKIINCTFEDNFGHHIYAEVIYATFFDSQNNWVLRLNPYFEYKYENYTFRNNNSSGERPCPGIASTRYGRRWIWIWGDGRVQNPLPQQPKLK